MKSTNQSEQPKRLSWRIVGGIVVVLIIMGGLLMLDLSNHGLMWQWFWSLTGEEEPLPQIRGMVEVAGTVLRQQPNTAPLTPIDHAGAPPFGINVFLEQEVEIPKIEEQLRMISTAGFTWLRQEFPWEDIEVDGRGQFTDSRFDYDGDGEPDTIDAWEKYDRIVDLAGRYGRGLQLRLSNPPACTRPNRDAGEFAPPNGVGDYVNYAVAVAERYRGRIDHYQIWNEPNIFPEWGNNFVNPEAYTDLLCQTYRALKEVDPEIVVLTGALAPTNAIDGYFGYNDFIFLQNIYDAGAGECFDVPSVNGYGLNSGPTDHRMRLTDINYARNIYIRDIMVANGDAHKPIWISEAAWNPVPDPEEVPEIVGRYNYGQVTDEQAARYMPIAYQRAQEEWPWIGVINYWFFTRRTIEESNQAFYYFRMAEADYGPEHPTFTPLPIYYSMQDYIAQSSVLYQGVHQAEHWTVESPDSAEIIKVDGAQFGDAVETESLTFTVHGADVYLRWRSDVPLLVEVGDEYLLLSPHYDEDLDYQLMNSGYSEALQQVMPRESVYRPPEAGKNIFKGDVTRGEDGWLESIVMRSSSPRTNDISLSSPYTEGTLFTIDSITVINRGFEDVFPLAAVGAALGLFVLVVLVIAVRKRLD